MSDPKQQPKRILVIKLADIGDVLTATPALRALRQTFPDATIDLLLTHHTQAVMQHSELVDHLIPSDNFRFFSPREIMKPGLVGEGLQVLRWIRQRQFDTVVLLHHLTTTAGAYKYAAIAKASGAKTVVGLAPEGKKGQFLTQSSLDEGFGTKHEIDYWLDVVGLLSAKTNSQEMELAVSEADLAWANLQMAVNVGDTSSPPIVVLHPGSGGFSTARRWAAAHFAQVADQLAERGVKIFIVGTASDGTDAVLSAMTHPAVNLTEQTTLHQLAALIKQADLYLGGDSGVTHIASTTGTPMVSIFGPTNAEAWGPRGENRIVLQAEVVCGPCAYVEHQVGLREGCPPRTCLKLITPESVFQATAQLLGGKIAEPKPQNVPPPTAQSPIQVQFPLIEILGVYIHQVSFTQTLKAIEAFIANGQPHQIVTVNPEFVVTAQQDQVFRQIINQAALAFADGNGLLKAARWLHQPNLPERIAGVDIVEAIAGLSDKKGYRLYFLGAAPGVAERTVDVLNQRYPEMRAVGSYAGSPHQEDEEEIVSRIQAANPDVVFVAYGAPNQDKWIARNMHRLPASVLIGVGGAFDFISGTTQRAPIWIQQAGLEWLHRFIKQPSRWHRIWNAVPKFLWLVWSERRKV
ncbi:MAG: WecB/TagA/CpsF family glycosyltransferase [Chloroflexota bacterium]